MAQMTDDDLRVRQLSHYQFQLALPVRAARPEPGRCSLCSTRGLGGGLDHHCRRCGQPPGRLLMALAAVPCPVSDRGTFHLRGVRNRTGDRSLSPLFRRRCVNTQLAVCAGSTNPQDSLKVTVAIQVWIRRILSEKAVDFEADSSIERQNSFCRDTRSTNPVNRQSSFGGFGRFGENQGENYTRQRN